MAGPLSNIPVTGMNAAQLMMQTGFHNISNAMNPDHRKIVRHPQALFIGGQGAGVTLTPSQRIVDEAQLADYLEKTSELHYYDMKNAIFTNIQRIIGSTADERSLSEKLKRFQSSCEALALNPNDPLKHNAVLTALQEICDEGAYITDQLNMLRTDCDHNIDMAVKQINAQLDIIDAYNQTIRGASAKGNVIVDVEDAKNARDAAIRAVGEWIDIRVETLDDGSVHVLTPGGIELVGYSVSPLEFTPTIGITPTSAYVPPPGSSTMNAIYAITVVGTPIDVTNGFSYGRLAALVEARDQIIPRLHAEHDLLFAQFRDSVNSIHNQGTGWPPATTLTGTRTFATPATAPFQGTGTVRFGIIDRTTGGFVATYDLDLTALGATTVQGLVINIDTALSAATGGSVTCTCNPGSGLQITSANPNYGIGIVSLGASAAVENTTQYGFSHYFGLNDLVTSPDVPSPGAVPTPGVAGQLAIRSDIVANPLLISRGQISAAVPAPALPVKAITTGDGRVMQLLSATLTANQMFVATGSLSQLQTPFTGYAAQIVATNAQQAAQVTTLFEEKQTHYNQIEADINRVSGVNIQEEMTTIFGWQALYAASTQCVKIVKENFQYLMNIF